jgi:predicted regulator of Ras-like GTPase activity (Roadblock/LC7/MglB family)
MFKEILEEINKKVEGSLGVLIVGVDGITIEQAAAAPDFAAEQLGVEVTSLIKKATRACTDAELGNLQELALMTDKARYLIKFITPDYFLLLAMATTGNYGRARYELKKAQLMMENEFTI